MEHVKRVIWISTLVILLSSSAFAQVDAVAEPDFSMLRQDGDCRTFEVIFLIDQSVSIWHPSFLSDPRADRFRAAQSAFNWLDEFRREFNSEMTVRMAVIHFAGNEAIAVEFGDENQALRPDQSLSEWVEFSPRTDDLHNLIGGIPWYLGEEYFDHHINFTSVLSTMFSPALEKAETLFDQTALLSNTPRPICRAVLVISDGVDCRQGHREVGCKAVSPDDQNDLDRIDDIIRMFDYDVNFYFVGLSEGWMKYRYKFFENIWETITPRFKRVDYFNKRNEHAPLDILLSDLYDLAQEKFLGPFSGVNCDIPSMTGGVKDSKLCMELNTASPNVANINVQPYLNSLTLYTFYLDAEAPSIQFEDPSNKDWIDAVTNKLVDQVVIEYPAGGVWRFLRGSNTDEVRVLVDPKPVRVEDWEVAVLDKDGNNPKHEVKAGELVRLSMQPLFGADLEAVKTFFMRNRDFPLDVIYTISNNSDDTGNPIDYHVSNLDAASGLYLSPRISFDTAGTYTVKVIATNNNDGRLIGSTETVLVVRDGAYITITPTETHIYTPIPPTSTPSPTPEKQEPMTLVSPQQKVPLTLREGQALKVQVDHIPAELPLEVILGCADGRSFPVSLERDDPTSSLASALYTPKTGHLTQITLPDGSVHAIDVSTYRSSDFARVDVVGEFENVFPSDDPPILTVKVSERLEVPPGMPPIENMPSIETLNLKVEFIVMMVEPDRKELERIPMTPTGQPGEFSLQLSPGLPAGEYQARLYLGYIPESQAEPVCIFNSYFLRETFIVE